MPDDTVRAGPSCFVWCDMSLSHDDVKKIAHLARIKIDDAELETLRAELNNIIGWVEQLSKVDTDGIEPMTSVVGTTLGQRNDSVSELDLSDKILANAPDRVGDFYAVPKVVE